VAQQLTLCDRLRRFVLFHLACDEARQRPRQANAAAAAQS